jgi:rhodanese-related sulfurtransferase
MKKTIIEIIIIVAVSAIIALFYNYIRPDGIPFIPKSKKELLVSDSLLFGDIFNQDTIIQEYTIKEIIEEVLITPTVDTVSTVKETKTVVENRIEEMDVATILRNVRKTSDGNYNGVSFDQMKRIVSSHSADFVIIDSRRETDFLLGHIPNAINIFAYDDAAVVIGKILDLPRNKSIIIYCDGGSCDLSHQIAALLENFGYERFFLYEGGWDEWSKKQ